MKDVRRPPLVALVVWVLAAAPAHAVSFGGDLSLPVTNTATCANAFPFAQGATSCLAYSVVPTSYAPARAGIVTAVRVKTGDFAQGPMQVVVLRSYYQNNLADPGHPNFFCCFLQEYGPVFTPARNTVTAVRATLGMVEDPTPPASDGNTVAKGDFLALSVLAPNVPIPLSLQDGGYAGFYAPAPIAPDNPPAPSPNGIVGGQGAVPGYVVMLNANIDPIDGATADGPVAAPFTGGRFRPGAANVPLICLLTTACTGKLDLLRQAGGRTARAAARPTVYGTARFRIKPGRKARVRVRFTAAGRRLARKHRRLTLYARTRSHGKTATQRVRLRRS